LGQGLVLQEELHAAVLQEGADVAAPAELVQAHAEPAAAQEFSEQPELVELQVDSASQRYSAVTDQVSCGAALAAELLRYFVAAYFALELQHYFLAVAFAFPRFAAELHWAF